MTPMLEMASAVRARRADMGLTQMALARLSGLSRATVNQLETGTIKDLSLTRAAKLLGVLGLSVRISPPHPPVRSVKPMGKARATPIDLATRTAGVSYRDSLEGKQLRRILLTGDISPGKSPHIRALLDEGSVSLLASVVEQLHAEDGVDRHAVWKRMRDLALRLHVTRDIWLA